MYRAVLVCVAALCAAGALAEAPANAQGKALEGSALISTANGRPVVNAMNHKLNVLRAKLAAAQAQAAVATATAKKLGAAAGNNTRAVRRVFRG